MDQESKLTTEEELRLRKSHLLRHQNVRLLLTLGALATGICIVGISLVVFIWPFGNDPRIRQGNYVIFAFGWVVLVSTYVSWVRLRYLAEEIQDTEFEIDLLKLETTPEEIRAEKLLRIYQFQLRRYFEVNLRQNSWIFFVGILCILIGVGVICATLALIREAKSWSDKTVLGSVGVIGTFLTNYVAAIYLKMQSGITETLTSIYSKIASTQKLFLANLLASRITDANKRWETLAQLSLLVADGRDDGTTSK